MYQIFDVTSDVNGEQQHEKMLITYEGGTDLMAILHKLGLEYALTPNGLKKYIKTGLSFNEFLSCLTPEMLEPYYVKIIWLDRGPSTPDCDMLISRYDLLSHLAAKERDYECMRKTREVAERYARNLGHLNADGHQLISTWDTPRIAERAASWACQFVRSNDRDAGKFFEKKLSDAVLRASQSPQSGDEDDEHSLPNLP